LDKIRKKLAINIKGNIFFGDERKEASAKVKEEKNEKTNKKKTKETAQATSEKYNKANMKTVQDALTRYDITNPFIQKAILATIAKES